MAYPQTSFIRTNVPPTTLVGRRRAAVASNTLLYQLNVLKKTGRYDAFKLQWHPSYSAPPEVWPIPNHLFWDSDVAKWIEGACYFLQQETLPEVDAAVKELVHMIRNAQAADGYLNIHYTVVEPGKRFTNLRDMHELYNAGHLIEAALAHNHHYGNDLLLEPIVKYVSLLHETFGPHASQTPGYPGHPEIELALLRLHERTGDPKPLELARFFLTERGNPRGCNGRHYFDVEAEKRGDDPAKRPAFYPEARCMWYHQAHALISEQRTIEGHSVRAMYLLTAVADMLRSAHGPERQPLLVALYELWDNMVEKKMYVTGGIGAVKQWEGFGIDYFLPQGTDEGGCYSETCAAIGVIMLAERFLKIDLNSRFADIMELCLYNAVLTSMSHDGKGFTYVNQLASSESDLSRREDWFTVACCPPNVLRLLGQIGGYIWNQAVGDNFAEVIVHLYVSSTLKMTIKDTEVQITQKGDWPWKGDVEFNVQPPTPVDLKLRIPGWAESFEVKPKCEEARSERGYLTLPAAWVFKNPSFAISVPMKPRWIAQSHLTQQNTVCLARGPVIYCVEDPDNTWVQDHFKNVTVDPSAVLEETSHMDDVTGDSFVGITLKEGAWNLESTSSRIAPFVNADSLGASLQKSQKVDALHFVPYYFRANRGGKGQMRVGLRKC